LKALKNSLPTFSLHKNIFMSTQKTKAFLLSALCLPGAGQLYLKQRLKGYLLISASCAAICYALIHFFKSYREILRSFPITQYKHHLSDAFFKLVTLTFEREWKILLGSLILLVVVWIISMLDLIFYPSESNKPE